MPLTPIRGHPSGRGSQALRTASPLRLELRLRRRRRQQRRRQQRQRRRLQPRGGGGPRGLRPAPARRLCSLHSNFSSCWHPARSRNRSAEDLRSRARLSRRRGDESRCLGYATGSPRHSAGRGPAAPGRAGRPQTDPSKDSPINGTFTLSCDYFPAGALLRGEPEVSRPAVPWGLYLIP